LIILFVESMAGFRISEVFRKGNVYDVVTKYREIPVRARLRLNWIDNEGRLLGFDWGRTQLRCAFSTLDPIYIRLNQKEYAQAQVFSNLGKELVLMVENFVGPPEFIRRRSVRVEPDENKPVLIEAFFEERKLETVAKDVSETGVGVVLNAKTDGDLVSFLREKFADLKENEALEFRVRIHLPDIGTAEGKGKLRNVVGLGKDVYVRLGLEVSFPREELNKIRKYVIERQKEIVKALRMVE